MKSMVTIVALVLATAAGIESSHAGLKQLTHIKDFDRNGELLGEASFAADQWAGEAYVVWGDDEQKDIYTYDDQKRLTRISHKSFYNVPDFDEIYENHDGNGNPRGRRIISPSGSLRMTETIEYNARALPERISAYDETGKYVGKTGYQYDDPARPYTFSRKEVYDKADRLIASEVMAENGTKKYSYGPGGSVRFYEVYEYDDGYPSKRSRFDNANNLIGYRMFGYENLSCGPYFDYQMDLPFIPFFDSKAATLGTISMTATGEALPNIGSFKPFSIATEARYRCGGFGSDVPWILATEKAPGLVEISITENKGFSSREGHVLAGQYPVYYIIQQGGDGPPPQLRQYTLTVKPAGGTVTGQGVSCSGSAACSKLFDEYTVVTLLAAPQTGYKVSGWTGCDSSAGAQCMVTMNKNRTVTAKYAKLKTYTLKVTSQTGGSVGSDPAVIACGGGGRDCKESFIEDTTNTVQLVASALPGYKFAGWTGACSGSDPTCTTTVHNANATVAAKFAKLKTYQLKVTSQKGGTVTSDPLVITCGEGNTDCTEKYLEGGDNAVILTVNPSDGYTFAGWTGACNGMAPDCSLTVSSTKVNTTAKFRKNLIQ